MKAVSSLIASVFLIVLVVTLAGIITAWLTTVVRETQTTVGERSGEGLNCANAAITIDNVFLSGGTGRAIERNLGYAVNLTLTTAVLINIDGRSVVASNAPLSNFNKGDIETLTFSDSLINCALFSKLVVTTDCSTITAEFSGPAECV